MEHTHHYNQDVPYAQHHAQWMDHPDYSSHHTSPIHEYPAYSWDSPSTSMSSVFDSSVPHSRPSHAYLQPLITTPWPSMLAAQSPQYASAPQPPAPTPAQHPTASAPPQLASSHLSNSTNPRRTLTDADRRRMCQYHEQHPKKKQTEIGEIFGVERSTVSKVLRHKDKYLHHSDGSRSPIKKSKPKHPDIERTLAKWAYNQQSKGIPVTDEALRARANFFWAATGNKGDCPLNLDSPSWYDKFRQRHNLSSARGSGERRSSLARSVITSPSLEDLPSPGASSRNESPRSAVDMATSRSQTSVASSANAGSHVYEGLGIKGARVPVHSLSNNSLSSAFTEAGTSANTSTSSPAFSPEAPPSSSSYFPPTVQIPTNTTVAPPPGASNLQRPRSQTFPVVTAADHYISPPQSAEASTPKYTSTAAIFESPVTDMRPPAPRSSVSSASSKTQGRRPSYPPPPNPYAPAPHPPQQQHHPHGQHIVPPITPSSSTTSPTSPHLLPTKPAPSLQDARQGLEAALAFLHAQPSISGADPAGVNAVRKMVQYLHMVDHPDQTQGGNRLMGGLQRIEEGDADVDVDGDVDVEAASGR